MDSGDAASLVALAVALFALLVALAQAIQQYFATAQNMRKCDKSVFGDMPGKPGQRIWTWHQFRFRIVYDMPNIFVAPSAAQVGLILHDTDRLPSDLHVVPMQVSLRDVIAFGLLIGMTITASERESLEMTGPSGGITSSMHPLMGRLIHFSAFATTPRSFYKGLRNGDISRSWLYRLQGVATVANRSYNEPKRKYYEGLGSNWRMSRAKLLTNAIPNAIPNVAAQEKTNDDSVQIVFVDMAGAKHSVPADQCQTWVATKDYLETNKIATPPFIILGPEHKPVQPRAWKALMRVVRQGNLNTTFKITAGDYVANDQPNLQTSGATHLSALETLIQGQEPRVDTSSPPTKMVFQGQEAQVVSDVDSAISTSQQIEEPTPEPLTGRTTEGVQLAAKARLERATPQKAAIEDESDNETGVHLSSEDSIIPEAGPLMLLRDANRAPSEVIRDSSTRPRFRRRQRTYSYGSRASDYGFGVAHTEGLYCSGHDPYYQPDPPRLTFFWACQIDVELGPWASPWAESTYRETQEALEMMIEVEMAGLVITTKQARMQNQVKKYELAVESGIEYVQFPDDPTLKELWSNLRDGSHTWPPYALNARGGSIDPTPHKLVQLSVFPEGEVVPPLLLLRSVQEALAQETRSADPSLMRDRNLELASIDYWLSHAATCPSIGASRSNLLLTIAGIVEEIWTTYGRDIMDIREHQWNREGGDSEIQSLARRMSAFLESHFPESPAEQFFIWVALLRATKVMQCIRDGPCTVGAQKLFDDDILVYLT
ncbi:MAG: hypothetical protein Q9196_005401 [Gyalolechia fulgens]